MSPHPHFSTVLLTTITLQKAQSIKLMFIPYIRYGMCIYTQKCLVEKNKIHKKRNKTKMKINPLRVVHSFYFFLPMAGL